MRAACTTISTLLLLIASSGHAAADEPEAGSETNRTAVSMALHAGPYWMIDREDRMFDGPAIAVSAELGQRHGWGAYVEVGSTGELAGGKGTCLAELSSKVGPSFTFEPGPSWFHVAVRGGPGVAFARLYGSLFGATTPTLLAHGDRVLPEAWGSLGAAATLGRWTFSVDLLAQWVPIATFHADSVPAGARSEFYPTFRRDHDLSTYGATAGVAFRF